MALGIAAGLWPGTCLPARAGDTSPSPRVTTRAQREFDRTKALFEVETNNPEAAWHFGRACFDLAEAATNKTERAQIATRGLEACRLSLARNPASAAAHYYLGMNLGQLADTRRNLSALHMVKEMEREFEAALKLDEHYDYAGPDRNLGLLYREAPVIASIGSRSKARQHLRRAVELAPDYPENRLNLIESCLKWGESAEARRQFQALEKLWPEAQRALTGEAWAASWQDWDQRRQTVKRKIEQPTKPLESPHHED